MCNSRRPDRIVIGVDFGTTFSGVAEAYSATRAKADEINVIKTWPGSNLTSDKVPSEIAYCVTPKTGKRKREEDTNDMSYLLGGAKVQSASYDNAKDSSNVTVQWGFQLQPSEPRLRCMKLFLDGRQELPKFVSRSEIKQQMDKSGKDAVTIITDYLREINNHTREELIKRYGRAFVKDTEIQWVLTVPAIWSDAAKDGTLAAARRAGIGPDLTLISEPEAAAIYTLQAMQLKQIKVGDNYVVCDAGGGTVDLISYEIKSCNPLRVEESVEGSGAMCGGAILNTEFEKFVRAKLSDSVFEKLCRDKPKAWVEALNYFETYVKRNYDPMKPKSFNAPFPGIADNEDAGIEDGYMTLTSREVAIMFKPISDDILALVKGQMDQLKSKHKLIAGVILVGGFGKSQCLRTVLSAELTKNPPSDRFEILQPANAWSAVVRGAVLRGMEGEELVISRKSRHHYGVVHNEPFNASIHPADCKQWDELEGKWMATNRMTWYIKKGDTVSSTEPMLFPFYRTYAKGERRTSTSRLIVCDSKVAPDSFQSYPGSPSRVLCSLTMNLRTIPARLWTKRTSPTGKVHDQIDYHLGMQVESGNIKFDLRVKGAVYGDITASFDAE